MIASESTYTVKSLPVEERPRERLLQQGAEALSVVELIAVLLGTGTRGKSILELSRELIAHFGSLEQLSTATIEERLEIKGLGRSKVLQLKAAFALGVRSQQLGSLSRYRIDTPLHAYNLVREELERAEQERLVAILQDSSGCVIRWVTVSVGTLSQTLIHPREVFYPAIRHKAASLILAHNHPSGDPTPSSEDRRVTQQLVQVGRMVGISINDHLIIGRESFRSLRQEGETFE